MSLPAFAFDPPEGYENSASFPDPSSEAQTRQQLMIPLNQLKDCCNQIINAVTAIEGATGDAQAISDITDAINNISSLFSVDLCMLEEE